MDRMVKIRRDEMYSRLCEELKGTGAEVVPYSPKKYDRDESAALNIRIDSLRPEMTRVCGCDIQIKRGPYKIWFYTHPEWEKITNYPVKDWATNRPGIGSGNGFYIDNIDDLAAEIRAFLTEYYDDILKL